MSRGAFEAGEKVQLTGPKGRMYTISLQPGSVYHTTHGAIAHDDLIGADDGSVITTPQGVEFLALRPRLRDVVMSMPRGAAIIYPKDAVEILSLADVGPGDRIVEAGVGSGALSMWLLRALAGSGHLYSFDVREEFAQIAQANATSFFRQEPQNWTITLGDVAEALPDTVEAGSIDAVLFDMLMPWAPLPQAVAALRPGGTFVAYVATVPQLSRVTEALRDADCFTEPMVTESMVREWHAEGLAVRPEHRMVAHTGFLICARRLADGVVPPHLSRRAPKRDSYNAEDMEIWTPGALGERSASPRKLRRAAREARAEADLGRQGPEIPGDPDEETQ